MFKTKKSPEFYHIYIKNSKLKIRVLGQLHIHPSFPRKGEKWGCFGGGTTKTPPHHPLILAIPRDP